MARKVPKPVTGTPTAPPPSFVALPAWVTTGPGLNNVLCTGGVAGRFVADFDRSGDIEGTEPQQHRRILRPGTIVLANLELDTPLPSPRPADVRSKLDAADNAINDPALPGAPVDSPGMTALRVRAPIPCATVASSIHMTCDPADAKRIRIFQVKPSLSSPQLGEGSSGKHELQLPKTPLIDFDYLIEAITLPGDPLLPAPTTPPPAPPTGLDVVLPAGAEPNKPIFKKRAPADVWLELQHQVSSPFLPLRDVGLVTIAPWLMLPNTRPVEKLYFVYFKRKVFGSNDFGNHDFAFDMCEAAAKIFGAANVDFDPTDDQKDLNASTPSSNKAVYLVDGALVNQDPWMQDELEIGYCWAPHAWVHVALHAPRSGGIEKFMFGDMPQSTLGIFSKMAQPGRPQGTDGPNYGGNLEVSPPVRAATARMPKSNAGPTVPAHPVAPFGKIIIGDFGTRAVQADFRNFLLAQRVQPVLPVNTGWLAVGHVDEFSAFIPSTTNARRWKVAFASIRAMTRLLKLIDQVEEATGFHAGKYDNEAAGARRTAHVYAEETSADMLKDFLQFNDRLRQSTLTPIQKRFTDGLALDSADIVPIPTYFKSPASMKASFNITTTKTVAHNVGSVNMQVVNKNLLVPRPFGPRMSPANAQRVVEQAMAEIGFVRPVHAGAPSDFVFWALPGKTLDEYAAAFARTTTKAQRREIVAHIKSGSALSPAVRALVTTKRGEISAVNGALKVSGGLFSELQRIKVKHDTVDVMELFIRTVLEAEGNTVHFIDDWTTYHCGLGEVHCASNVARTPPELDAAFKARWWDHYDPDLNLEYDPNS